MPTHHNGSETEKRALNAYIKLIRAAETVLELVGRHIAQSGLTPGQFAVLEALYHLGPLRPGDVARKLLRSGGNITTVLDNLARRRLVEREASKDDRRSCTIVLTPEGQRLMEQVFPKQAAKIAELMSVLAPEEQEELSRLARKLGVTLREENCES